MSNAIEALNCISVNRAVALCPNLSIDKTVEALIQSDELIAKSLDISEVAQIARTETILREYFEAQWNKIKSKAIADAVRMGKAGKTASQISSHVIKQLNKWSGVVEKNFRNSIRSIYRKARIAAYRKTLYRSEQNLTYDTPNFESVQKANIPRDARVLPMFDVVDERAVDALEDQHMFWVKEHVDKNLSKTIRTEVKASMIEAGKGRVEAGRLLREKLTKELGQVKTPSGWHGSQRQYFEGLAANAATTARTHGHMRSFIDLGVKKYEIINPRDERTCVVCSMMDGKVFAVSQGTKVIENEMSATSPEGIKEAHPWYSEKELKGITSGSGHQSASDSQALADAGYSVPPYHFRCFEGSTVVWTRKGKVHISEIKVGDEVLTHKMRWKKVTAIMARNNKGEFIQMDEFISTEDHPYLINRDGDIIFDAVKEMDLVATIKKSLNEMCESREEISGDVISYIPIGNIKRFRDIIFVWNLTVEDDESFVVGGLGYIVHNCRCSVSVSEEPGSFEGIVETPPTPKRVSPPKWKPVMDDKEAKKYIQDSRIKQTLFHGTKTASDILTRTGLAIVADKINTHKGISLLQEKVKAESLSRKGTLVTAKVNVENPLRTTSEFWKGSSTEPAHLAVYEELPTRIKPKKATIGQLSKAAEKAGYDGWYNQTVKGKISELRVFNKEQVAVIELKSM